MQTLKKMREAKGIEQAAVAEYLGISLQTYDFYERYPALMDIAQAQAICRFLECSIEDIFFS